MLATLVSNRSKVIVASAVLLIFFTLFSITVEFDEQQNFHVKGKSRAGYFASQMRSFFNPNVHVGMKTSENKTHTGFSHHATFTKDADAYSSGASSASDSSGSGHGESQSDSGGNNNSNNNNNDDDNDNDNDNNKNNNINNNSDNDEFIGKSKEPSEFTEEDQRALLKRPRQVDVVILPRFLTSNPEPELKYYIDYNHKTPLSRSMKSLIQRRFARKWSRWETMTEDSVNATLFNVDALTHGADLITIPENDTRGALANELLASTAEYILVFSSDAARVPECDHDHHNNVDHLHDHDHKHDHKHDEANNDDNGNNDNNDKNDKNDKNDNNDSKEKKKNEERKRRKLDIKRMAQILEDNPDVIAVGPEWIDEFHGLRYRNGTVIEESKRPKDMRRKSTERIVSAPTDLRLMGTAKRAKTLGLLRAPRVESKFARGCYTTASLPDVFLARRKDLIDMKFHGLENYRDVPKNNLGTWWKNFDSPYDAFDAVLFWLAAKNKGKVALSCSWGHVFLQKTLDQYVPATTLKRKRKNDVDTASAGIEGKRHIDFAQTPHEIILRQGKGKGMAGDQADRFRYAVDAYHDTEARIDALASSHGIVRIIRADGMMPWSICLRARDWCDSFDRTRSYTAMLSSADKLKEIMDKTSQNQKKNKDDDNDDASSVEEATFNYFNKINGNSDNDNDKNEDGTVAVEKVGSKSKKKKSENPFLPIKPSLSAAPCCARMMLDSYMYIRKWLFEKRKWTEMMKSESQKKRIPFWVMYGSAIGALRDKKIIPWDWDLDIATDDQTIDVLLNHMHVFRTMGWFTAIEPGHYMIERSTITTADLSPHIHFNDQAYVEASNEVITAEGELNGIFDPSVTSPLTTVKGNLWRYNYYQILLDLYRRDPSVVTPLRNMTFSDTWVLVGKNEEKALTDYYGDWRKPNREQED